MLNIIVGENASGKTVALRDILSRFHLRDVATNLRDTSKYQRNIVNEKVERLWRQIPFNVENRNNNIFIESADEERDPFDYGGCKPLVELITTLCSDKKYFIWDEPEYNIPEGLKDWAITCLMWLYGTFDEAWITTRFDGMECMYDTKFFKVNSEGYLEQIEAEEAGELLAEL